MLILYIFLALCISAIVLLAPSKPRIPSDTVGGPERRHPEKRLKDQDPFAERRKDDHVGGEGG